MKRSINRLGRQQPDYLFAIVRRPPGWVPAHYADTPPVSQVIAISQVASFEEAHDDLLRCNTLSLTRGLDRWAVIHTPDGAE